MAMPDDVLDARRWVCWRAEERDGRATKVPLRPRDLARASVTHPADWDTYETACCRAQERTAMGEHVGVGLVLGEGITGIDLDHVMDRETGDVEPWAQRVLELIDSYAEISPSGTGLHILCRSSLPVGGRRKGMEPGGIEIYTGARYFTFGGRDRAWSRWAEMGLEERTPELRQLLHELSIEWPTNADRRTQAPMGAAGNGASSLDVQALIEAATVNIGKPFVLLHAGKWDHASQSQADWAYCCMLARCGFGAEHIDAMMRASGLMRPKWDSPRGSSTYGAHTIREAIAAVHAEVVPRGTFDPAQIDAQIEHARQHAPGAVPGLEAARAELQRAHEENRAAAERKDVLSDADTARDELGRCLGIGVVRVIQSTREEPIYHVELDGRDVVMVFARTEDLLSAARWNAELVRVADRMLPAALSARKAWASVRELIVAAKRLDDGTYRQAQETREWIDDYLARSRICGRDESSRWQEALPGAEPFEDEEGTWIHLGRLTEWLSTRGRISKREIESRMRWIGARRKDVSGRPTPSSPTVRRSYWLASPYTRGIQSPDDRTSENAVTAVTSE